MRIYTAEISATLTTSKTMVLIESPSNMVLEIRKAQLTNVDNDTAEQLEAGLFMVQSKGSPSGTSITPEKYEKADPSSSTTVLGSLSGEPGGYNGKAIDVQGFSNLAGYYWQAVGTGPIVNPTGLVGLRLLSTPASGNFRALVEFAEIG